MLTGPGIGLDFDEPTLDKMRFYSSFILENNQEIMEIMDDLYKDPANVKIKLDWMCITAVIKLVGGDFEVKLQAGRLLGILLEGF